MKSVIFAAILIIGLTPSAWAASNPAAAADPVFFDFPEILVNLKSEGTKRVFMKARVVLELENAKDVKKIEKVLPRVMDAFITHLRGLSAADVEGRDGLEMLRKDLLSRLNKSAAPAKVVNVLFKEILFQ